MNKLFYFRYKSSLPRDEMDQNLYIIDGRCTVDKPLSCLHFLKNVIRCW